MTQAGLKAAVEYAVLSEDFLKCAAKNFTVEELEQLWGLLKRFYAFDGVEWMDLTTTKLLEENQMNDKN
jgi:Mlc titration factor MtfA (ptsG expression regulator)